MPVKSTQRRKWRHKFGNPRSCSYSLSYSKSGRRQASAVIKGSRWLDASWKLHLYRPGLEGEQLPQHVLQDAAIGVVESFLRGVDAHQRAEFCRPVAGGGAYLDF